MSAKLDLYPERDGAALGEINLPAFGALSYKAKDQYYLLPNGFIYTSPRIVTQTTTRFSASILLTTNGEPFDITVDGRTSSYQAVVIRQLVERGLRADNVPLVSVQVNPYHPLYRRFRGIQHPGVLALDRSIFAEFDDRLNAIYSGKVTPFEANGVFEGIVGKTGWYLPKGRRAKKTDPRIEQALTMLRENPRYPLGDLATAHGLSYDRMSHLFADVVGLPLRSYSLWVKFRTAALLRGSGLTLTQISDAAGFNDTAHLSNTWQQAFGHTPSQFFFDSDFMQLHFWKPCDEAGVGTQEKRSALLSDGTAPASESKQTRLAATKRATRSTKEKNERR